MKKNYTLISILIASFLMFCNVSIHAQNDASKNDDCGLFQDFENSTWTGTGAGSYTNRTVTDDLGAWSVSAVTNMTETDRFIDAVSARFRGNSSDNTNLNRIEMLFDKSDGLGTVSFAYASFSTHSGGVIYLQYSTDQGASWIDAGNVTAPAWNNDVGMLTENFALNVLGNARIRIFKNVQTGNTSVNIDNICITDFTDPNTVATPSFTPSGGNFLTPQTVTISCATEGATIRYTLDGSEPTESSATYSAPLNISTTTTVKAKAWKAGFTSSGIATATYSFPVEVPNINAFKAANPATSSTIYKITGDVTFVFRNGRNIYIKDATGGLLIYDNSPSTITNEYEDGDIISGGVIGTCTIFNGLYELIPGMNLATGTPGAPVSPTIVTMENLLANFANYESQLIKLRAVTFDEGTFGTGAAANIPIHQDESSMVCRNHYGTFTDYETNPDELFDVTGFAVPYNADRQIAPRALSDITLHSGTVTYIIYATAGANGTINPQGEVIVEEGANQTFTMTPNDGYKIENVLVDGTNIGQPSTHTFNNITSSHTISVSFVLKNDIAENDLDKLISIYPNPTTGELRITNYELRIESVEVFDVYGRKVSSYQNVTEKINIETLSSGVYFVKVRTDKGEVVKRVVKE